MVQVALTQKLPKFIWIDKVSEKYLWNSDIFSKDVTRWSVYLLKTFFSVFQTISWCKSIILPPNELNICLQKLQLNITINVI